MDSSYSKTKETPSNSADEPSIQTKINSKMSAGIIKMEAANLETIYEKGKNIKPQNIPKKDLSQKLSFGHIFHCLKLIKFCF